MTEEIETLNQENDVTEYASDDEAGLFDDYDASLNGDTPIANDEEEKSVEPNVETENTEVAPFLTVKYNKEEKGLSQEEAIAYAQKGMNYDQIYERFNSLKDFEPYTKEINRLAKLNDMSVGDYVKNLSDVQTKFEINKEVARLQEKYPDSDEELINELAQRNITERNTSKEKEQVDARKQEIDKQVDKFSKRYPNVDPSKLDASVYSLMKEGYTLLEAYQTVENDKRIAADKVKESQAEIQRKNEENKAKSLGNISSTDKEDQSDFLSGLFSD